MGLQRGTASRGQIESQDRLAGTAASTHQQLRPLQSSRQTGSNDGKLRTTTTLQNVLAESPDFRVQRDGSHNETFGKDGGGGSSRILGDEKLMGKDEVEVDIDKLR